MTQAPFAPSRTYFPRLLAALSFVVASAILSACGGGDGDQSATSKPTPGLSVLAGMLGGFGNIDGATGRFLWPEGVAIDATGNHYVADSGNHTIRKRAPDGKITTLAGLAGVSGSTDGVGSEARFSQPSDIAVDDGGNLYVCDNAGVRKIAPGGVVTTLAPLPMGSGSFGGLAVDVNRFIYAAGGGRNTVLKISPAGDVAVFAGTGAQGSADGPAALATFSYVSAVALDRNGNVYVADRDNFTIRRISPAGVVTTVAGTAGLSGAVDAVGTAARFAGPAGIALDPTGAIYITDAGDFRAFNNTIRRIGIDGAVSTIAGKVGVATPADGAGVAASFADPRGIAVDNFGIIFVADVQASAIRKVTSLGEVATIAGSLPATGATDGVGPAARFASPQNVAVDGTGTIYVADFGNHLIRKITQAGATTTLAGKAGIEGTADGTLVSATFANPSGIALGPGGTVYVADSASHRIRKISPDGTVTTLAGANWPTPGGGFFPIAGSVPVAIAVDGSGNAYVADSGMNIIRKVGADGIDGVLTSATAPRGIALDTSGNLYVSDSGNHTIRKITVSGQDTIVAGAPGASGSADGNRISARFNDPGALSVDGTGNIYVADTGNHLVRMITVAGAVTTIAGRRGSVGVIVGELPGSLNAPIGMAVDVNGVLYTTSENSVLGIRLP
jgi:sugar lactone lactonase YvrE